MPGAVDPSINPTGRRPHDLERVQRADCGTVGAVTRIVAGVYGGRRLTAPDGRDTRPTADRVREALFNTLAAVTDLDGARFADLYAGSGAVGLEAASRGASHVLLVEAAPVAARAARSNIATLGAGAVVMLRTSPVLALVTAGAPEPYDIVFADPPYAVDDDEIAVLLEALRDNGWLASGATVVVERSTRTPAPAWPIGIEPERSRRYGETTLWYGRRS
jgi:16S rRNA (guanine966-N2)-methyltransferase